MSGLQPEPWGGHRVWRVVPSREKQRDGRAIALKCDECGYRIEGHPQGVDHVIRERPCPITEWEHSSTDGGAE